MLERFFKNGSLGLTFRAFFFYFNKKYSVAKTGYKLRAHGFVKQTKQRQNTTKLTRLIINKE